ncbi:helix-turn-helix domain-containing protein [Streptomyces antarcticus]|uniref:helix-turn-helix domain-containing protein n=1 Tax=Streptomyces antarcticus TaxID=2996458 RepID=UPI00226FB2DF|nr:MULTISPECIES: helix-turn-helix transcriptional regulator [unclassified Streptomyces]MCY0943574.1 helix-turn-helix transcriptional regulator [Streptomyces sp. H34-AA3]MCZ4083517.1 helix-turn-helix transcriptional regulator [Streptomyces sp. H34-S5]
MPTIENGSASQGSRTERFAEYIRQAVREAGYDIDSPRGGGKTRLARDTGMSTSSVGRMLAGKSMPDPAFMERLASALRMPLREMLFRSGLVTDPNALAPARPASPGEGGEPLTSADAARRLGIRSPARVAMFEGLVAHLVREEREEAEVRGGS